MARFRIRAATLRDLDVLVLHRRHMWEDLGERGARALGSADSVYRRWARQRLRTRRLAGFIAEDAQGMPVASGCVWLRSAQPRPGRSLAPLPYLLSMYTEPEVRGRGLATRIVREAIRWCRREGHSRLILHASAQGRGLYRRLGFTRTWEMRLPIPGKETESERAMKKRRRASLGSRRSAARRKSSRPRK